MAIWKITRHSRKRFMVYCAFSANEGPRDASYRELALQSQHAIFKHRKCLLMTLTMCMFRLATVPQYRRFFEVLLDMLCGTFEAIPPAYIVILHFLEVTILTSHLNCVFCYLHQYLHIFGLLTKFLHFRYS